MDITLTHCRYAPTWETLQKLIQETTNDPHGQLIRIARKDRGCDYRAPGDYDLGFRLSVNKCILPINLTIKGV